MNDGTWEKDTTRHALIIALATEATSLRAKLNHTTVALATATSNNTNNSNNGTNIQSGPKVPYTIKAWRLEKEGETKGMGSCTYHCCTTRYYSDGNTYNGMYCLYDTAGHNVWRAEGRA